MTNSIVIAAEEFVTELFRNSNSKNLYYHDINHTLRVRDAAITLAQEQEFNDQDIEIITLATLFHDTGYLRDLNNHEMRSAEIARNFLAEKQYEPVKIDQVSKCIIATTIGVEPETKLEATIKDADLSNLGSDNFFDVSDRLRAEWRKTQNKEYDDEGWYKESLDFLKNHKYYTSVAKEKYALKKKANQKKMKKLLKQEKATKELQGDKTLNQSKSAQMMFKTALRNHIDLTNIADNKANIMLSINTIVISIIMSLFASNINDNRFLIIPVSILLVTCVVSIIFATLATRPIKMSGHTPIEKIREGKANLFFFGNFYKMNLNEYRDGLQTIVNDDSLMDDSIMRDLYFLGKALGNKYNLLRTCYLVFMTGITISVIAFAISFMTNHPG